MVALPGTCYKRVSSRTDPGRFAGVPCGCGVPLDGWFFEKGTNMEMLISLSTDVGRKLSIGEEGITVSMMRGTHSWIHVLEKAVRYYDCTDGWKLKTCEPGNGFKVIDKSHFYASDLVHAVVEIRSYVDFLVP